MSKATQPKEWTDRSIERLAFSYSEVSEALGICPRAVWQLVKDGQLRAVRIGRSVRIPRDELKRFITERSRSTATEGGTK